MAMSQAILCDRWRALQIWNIKCFFIATTKFWHTYELDVDIQGLENVITHKDDLNEIEWLGVCLGSVNQLETLFSTIHMVRFSWKFRNKVVSPINSLPKFTSFNCATAFKVYIGGGRMRCTRPYTHTDLTRHIASPIKFIISITTQLSTMFETLFTFRPDNHRRIAVG